MDASDLLSLGALNDEAYGEAVAAIRPSADWLPASRCPGARPAFVAGPRSATPIVLLHPFGVDWRVWLPVAASLRDDYAVVAPDLAGHGVAERDSVLRSMDEAADDVAHLLDELGYPRAVIVGCSMGGAVAQAFALRHPARVSALALLATFCKGGDAHADRARRAEADGTAAQVDGTLERWFGAARTGTPRDIAYAVRMLHAMPVQRWSAAWRAMAATDHEARLPDLAMPVLTVAGGADVSTTDAAMRAMSATIPGAVHMCIDGAPHMLILTHAEEVAALLRDFLAAQAR